MTGGDKKGKKAYFDGLLVGDRVDRKETLIFDLTKNYCCFYDNTF
jgi:hypothetical protein